MPTFLDLCKMTFITYLFIQCAKWFCYGVVWVVKRRQFEKDKKMLQNCVQKSKRRKSTIHFHEILEHKN
jgi:hypothetical protein